MNTPLVGLVKQDYEEMSLVVWKFLAEETARNRKASAVNAALHDIHPEAVLAIVREIKTRDRVAFEGILKLPQNTRVGNAARLAFLEDQPPGC